jgi:predicted 3-demethylubiquinone-9 3-methyltransferase (glyoxalase superfamily)
MKNKITPCLWFDYQAEEAVNFYTSLFVHSHILRTSRYGKEGFEVHGQKEGTVLAIDFHLSGQPFTAMNGGPLFKFNPSVSFYVVCETELEVDYLWKNLSDRGNIMMELSEYPWSKKYGWLNDRFGLSWQIAFDKIENTGQKITPALMFMGQQHSLAEEAIKFYTSVFPFSMVKGILRYVAGENEPVGSVKHAQFRLKKQMFMIMGNSMQHAFGFNEAISFQVFCDLQSEIDYYWTKLSEGGSEGQCGWLKDKYGVSWQIVPAILPELMADPEKSDRVMKAFLQMTKFNIDALLRA